VSLHGARFARREKRRNNDMQHLKNILFGVGDVLAAFGTAPSYRYPQPGDRRKDAAKISGDWRTVGQDMRKSIKRDKDGAVNHGAAKG